MHPDPTPGVSGPSHMNGQLARRPHAELAASPLIAHAPLAVAVTVTTAGVTDALLLALVGLFAGLSVFVPPELIPFVSRLLAGCALLVTTLRVGFSVAMWAGGRAARTEPTAAAMVGFTKAIVGRWWWTAAMVVVLAGVAVALVAGWPAWVTVLLAGSTLIFGLGRAVFIIVVAKRSWSRSN